MPVKIEIVCIGDELLRGSIVNTNASYLSQVLFSLGLSVERHVVLSDERKKLEEGLRESIERSDWIICTGGLGDTQDDVTKQALANILELSPALLKAERLDNSEGQQPGLYLVHDGKHIVLLPGVPHEVKAIVEKKLLAKVKKFFQDEKTALLSESLFFCLLPEAELDRALKRMREEGMEIEWGLYPSYERLVVVLLSKDPMTIKQAKERLRKAFFSYEIVGGGGKLSAALQEIFIKEKKTLAFAESCTGGFLSHLITSNAGSSKYFLGSFVTYSNFLKEKILFVDEEVLTEKGAVSKETVEQMLRGLFKETSADFGLAVSGIAGPDGGSDQKPVGTVFFAFGPRGGPFAVGSFHIPGGRERVITWTSYRLLGFLYRSIQYRCSPA
jgi:nicotinamide-nucleotide amidase